MMVQMIARERLPYNRRDLRAGEPFEAYPRDAKVLALLGKARYATKVEEPAEVYAVMAAETGVEPEETVEPVAKKKRTYRRKKVEAVQADPE